MSMFNRLRRLLKIGLTVCCLVASCLLPCAAVAQADGIRTNRALLIGVDDFVSRPSTYPSSTNNVFAIQEALQASSTPFDTIMIPPEPVTGPDALAELIRDTFAQADEDDVSYLYISTHGVYDDPEKATGIALLLSDGKTEGRMTPKQLQDALSGVKGTKVILLDACYSGAFIGKGMRKQPKDVYFLGDEYKVLTSSGAMEESWYWNTTESTEPDVAASYEQGAFYFTQALSQSLSPRYGYPADANRDGNITLKELYTCLLENHAVSTPQVYPQEDNFVVFSYRLNDADRANADRSPIGDVTFSSSTLSATDQKLTLEFIALRPVRVAYQVVNQREGVWRFDEAQLLYDDMEQYTAYGDEQGAISPGRKVRTIALNLQNSVSGGYVLVQLVSIEDGKLTVHAGRVIAIPPEKGNLDLGVEVDSRYSAKNPRELAVFAKHACPCQLSVSIVDQTGKTVRRLCHRQSTRPLRIVPEGSTFYWDGLDKSGQPVENGQYRVQVTGYMSDQTFTAESQPIDVTDS